MTGSVASQLALAPDRLRIDGVAIGQSASTQVLVRAAKPFRVTGVDGTGDGITVELPSTPTPLPVQRITVKFDPAKEGAISRQLLIKTDLDGGASVNDGLLQYQADVMQLPVVRPKVTETTALGAAYLAGLAVGYWQDTADVARNWALDREFVPAMPAGRSEALYDGWRKAVQRSLGWARV